MDKDKNIKELAYKIAYSNKITDQTNLGSTQGIEERAEQNKARKQVVKNINKIIDRDEEDRQQKVISISIEEYQNEFLNGLRDITGVSKSEFIRGLIDMAISNMAE